jgi:NTE family protein
MTEAASKHSPSRERSGRALCLSGGGFRATLFHLGALRRLNELGVLHQIDSFSSVSGGSILNGVLASRWDRLVRGPAGGASYTNFSELIEAPVRAFCARDLRTPLMLRRLDPRNLLQLLGPDHSVTDLLADAYATELDLGMRLGSLRPGKTFVFCAANLETGANWEFEIAANGKAEVGDYVVGKTDAAGITLAQAVAASSAFPVVFPPLVLRFSDPALFRNRSEAFADDYRRRVPLTDGGVYDNLGLEPVWKSHEMVFVSNAGRPFELEDDPGSDPKSRLLRSYDVTSRQAEAVRVRWLVSSFISNTLEGTYWGIASDAADYDLPGARGYPPDQRRLIERIRTDLDPFSEGEIGCLMNHGYSISDVAVRKWTPRAAANPAAAFAWPDPAHEPARAVAVVDAIRDSGRKGILKDLLRAVFRDT